MGGLAEYIGNIDLDNRKVFTHPDGSKSTELSKSFAFGDENNPIEVLLPTIVEGQPVSDDQAVQHYFKTGKHLGQFRRNEWMRSNPEADMEAFYKSINDYANKIHNRQGERYAK